MFYVIPSFVICAIWFLPESPRWLILKDRHEDARRSLTRLRAGKFTEEEIEQELQEMIESMKQERERETGGVSEIFRGNNLRRTLIVLVVNFFLQATGQAFASQYGALFIKSLGTINQFTLQMIQACINAIIATSAMFASDNLGRRKMLLIGGVIQASALLTMGGLGTVADPTYQLKSAIVGMMVVFVAGYTFGWAPVVHVLSAELPSSRLRDVTYGAGTLVNVATKYVCPVPLAPL